MGRMYMYRLTVKPERVDEDVSLIWYIDLLYKQTRRGTASRCRKGKNGA